MVSGRINGTSPGQHQQVGESAYGVAQNLNRMAGAELPGLPHEPHPAIPNRPLDLVGLMADDDKNLLRRRTLQHRVKYMLQQRLPPDRMQNFGAFRFEPRALARSQDCNCTRFRFHHPNRLTALEFAL